MGQGDRLVRFLAACGKRVYSSFPRKRESGPWLPWRQTPALLREGWMSARAGVALHVSGSEFGHGPLIGDHQFYVIGFSSSLPPGSVLRILVLVAFLLIMLGLLVVGSIWLMRWGRRMVLSGRSSRHRPTACSDVWSSHILPNNWREATDEQPGDGPPKTL